MGKWDMVQLSSIATLMTDGNWIESKDQSLDGIRLLQVGNIGKGYYIDKADRAKYISEEAFVKLKCTEVYDGDVLVSRLPDPIGRACIVPKLDTKLITAVDCTIIRTLDEKCCFRYLLHFLCSPQYFWQIEKFIVGSTRSRISRTNLQSISLPLPPFPIQQRIADILDRTSVLIKIRKEQIVKLDLLIKSQFIEMFGDPVRNPLGWNESTLAQHLQVVGGYAFKSGEFLNEGIPVLRIGNINTGFFKENNLVYWQNDKRLERYLIYPNDVVISLTGTVGKDDYANICILGDDYGKYYLNQRNAKLDLSDTLCKYYLTNILRVPEVKAKLTGISRGIRQANISNSDILNLRLPIPPIDLQNRFADFVQQVDRSKSDMKQGLQKLELLYNSLMQKCFNGELF
jgi:type I restriction enzyme S subunit